MNDLPKGLVERIQQEYQSSSSIIDGMILTLHDNPKIKADDIERLIEFAQNILEAFYE